MKTILVSVLSLALLPLTAFSQAKTPAYHPYCSMLLKQAAKAGTLAKDPSRRYQEFTAGYLSESTLVHKRVDGKPVSVLLREIQEGDFVLASTAPLVSETGLQRNCWAKVEGLEPGIQLSPYHSAWEIFYGPDHQNPWTLQLTMNQRVYWVDSRSEGRFAYPNELNGDETSRLFGHAHPWAVQEAHHINVEPAESGYRMIRTDTENFFAGRMPVLVHAWPNGQ